MIMFGSPIFEAALVNQARQFATIVGISVVYGHVTAKHAARPGLF